MKKLVLILLALLPILSMAQEFDFAKTIGGNKIYFAILTTGGKQGPTVEVTFPHSEEQPWKGYTKPSGTLSIPETVTPDRSRAKDADPDDDDTTIYRVVSIRYNAFQGCDKITRLVLPPSIIRIEENAFAGCRKIANLVSQAPEPPRLDESSFLDVDINIPVRIPSGSFERYNQSLGWRIFTEMVEY